VALVALGAIALGARRSALQTLPAWPLPTALLFLLMTRPLMPRHLAYLVPGAVTLMAVALCALLRGEWRLWREPLAAPGVRRAPWAWAAPVLLLALGAAYPWALSDRIYAERHESDSLRLSALIQKLTTPDELVLSGYSGISFLAGRRTLYWTSSTSDGAASSGQITAAAIIAEMERRQPSLVILDNDPTSDLHKIPGASDLLRAVQARYVLVETFHRGKYLLSIYRSQDTLPLRPRIAFGESLALTGVRGLPAEAPAGKSLLLGLRWQALQRLTGEHRLQLRLVADDGVSWGQSEEVPIAGVDPFTASWEAGQGLLQEQPLRVATALAPGHYTLVVRVLDVAAGRPLLPGDAPRLPASSSDAVIASLRVVPAAAPPRPEELTIPVRLPATLAPGLQLLGSRSLPRGMGAGRTLDLALFWYAPTRPPQDYRLEFRLWQGDTLRQSWPAPLAAEYPASTWRDGEVLLARYNLTLDAALPDGRYDLRVAALSPEGAALGEAMILYGLTVRAARDAAAAQRSLQHPLAEVSFAGSMALLGYDLSAETLAPGSTLALTLTWRCEQAPPADYTVFVHLLDGTTAVRAQEDAPPGQGSAPTSGWEPGEVIVDRHELTLPPDAAMGPLRLEIGLYEPRSGARLRLWRAGQPAGWEQLLLPTVVSIEP
jgi:hypothetical protein